MELTLTVVAAASGARADVTLRAAGDATWGEVTSRLLPLVAPGAAETGALHCDGSLLDAHLRLADTAVREGSVLTLGAPTRDSAPLAGLLELRVVGGPAAGAVHRLRPGEHVLGRAASSEVRLDDPDVSRRHALLRVAPAGVTVADLDSTNGTRLDGSPVDAGGALLTPGALLQVGESALQLVIPDEPPAAVTPRGDGTLSYNRPPRLRPPMPVARIELPAPPSARRPARLPLPAIVMPLLLGAVMALFVSPRFLLFMLLSPVMLAGQALSDRVGGRREARADRAAYDEALAAARARMADAARADAAARRAGTLDPAALLLAATTPRPRLWERRRQDDDFLALSLGNADRPARVEVVAAPGAGAEPPPVARSVPVMVPLAQVGVLGLAGPRPLTQAVARWLAAQVAGLHSPRDVGLVVLAEPAAAAAWEWARWLPHARPDAGQDCQLLLGVDAPTAAARVAELGALVAARRSAGAGTHRVVVVVVDGAHALRRTPGLAELLAEGPAVGVHAICLDADEQRLPEECGAVAAVTGEAATRLLLRVRGGEEIGHIVADAVDPAWAERVARGLAPLRDDSPGGGVADLPGSVRFSDIAGLPLAGGPGDVDALLARWSACGTSFVLGAGPDGPLALDLRRDGPHALVAGTTGSGKSELLQTLVAGLAAGNRPDALCFVLIDYKGGAAFGACARLPHTVGMVTDLDGPLTERALLSLGAELRRREAALRAVGAADLDGYASAARERGLPTIPRLVLVVDEFATLAEELPDFVGGLVGIAQRGRSLGVHLVLATQRPEGVVSADIRANTNLRICLAVTRDAESRDVLDTGDAALISRSTPGRAFVRTGHGELTPMQTARVAGVRAAAGPSVPAVRLSPYAELGRPAPGWANGPIPADAAGDLDLLVAAARGAADHLGLAAPASPWLPPLPEAATLADLPATGCGVGFGLQDLPAEQRRGALTFDPDRQGHLLVVGAPRSGRTTALRTLSGALARHRRPDALHLYAIDGGGALRGLADLPHCGAVVTPDQIDRVDRLLGLLSAEVEHRQRLLAAGGHAGLAEQHEAAEPDDRLPHLLLLLDRWETFLAAFQDLDGGKAVDTVHGLLREGPAVGLHVVISADRGALAGRLAAAIDTTLVLRLADRGDFAMLGLPPRAVPSALPPGRGYLTAGLVPTQVALLAPDPGGSSQAAALAAIAAAASTGAAALPRHRRPRRVDPLPVRVSVTEAMLLGDPARATTPTQVVLGVGGDELAPVRLDLAEAAPGFVVAGPPATGRSSALCTVASGLLGNRVPLVVIAPRRSPLRALDGRSGVVDVLTGGDDAARLSEALDRAARSGRPVGLLVDDAELLADSAVAAVIEGQLRTTRDRAGVVVVGGTTDDLAVGFRGFVVEARRSRAGLLLCPQSPLDGELLGARLPRSAGALLPAGRGLLVQRGRAQPIQVALPDWPEAIAEERQPQDQTWTA